MEKQYIIIAGTNKGGTSSLFNYLANHPQACGSFIKQTNYFLSNEYPHVRQNSIFKYGKESYDSFFRDYSDNQICFVDASPDYMYDSEAVVRMSNYFKSSDNFKIIFILRNPIQRFISWYNFGKQIRAYDEISDIRGFYRKNIENLNANIENIPFMNILKTGNYSQYIKPYIDTFGQDKVEVLFYEDMVKDTQGFMKSLSSKLGIDAVFYEDYDFLTFNKTVSVKNKTFDSLYRLIRKSLFFALNRSQFLFDVSKGVRVFFTKGYRYLNTTKKDKEQLPIDIKNELILYYQSERFKLSELVGRTPDWEF